MELSLEQVVGALLIKGHLPNFGDEKFMAEMLYDDNKIGSAQYFEDLGVFDLAHEDRVYIPVKLPKKLVTTIENEVLNKQCELRGWHMHNSAVAPLTYKIKAWKSYVVDFINSFLPEEERFPTVTPEAMWKVTCDKSYSKLIRELKTVRKYEMARSAAETYSKCHMTFQRVRNFYDAFQEGKIDTSDVTRPIQIADVFVEYCTTNEKEINMLPQVVRHVSS